MTETWPEYLRRISGGKTQGQIAEQIGIGRLSVCNWLHGKTRPKAETVILVARVFHRSPIEALVAAGYLEPDELDRPLDVRVSLADLPAAEIADEVRRRLLGRESQGRSEYDGLVPESDHAVFAVPLHRA